MVGVEEPKQHDFDQRHDGPFDVPPIVHDTTKDSTRHSSAPNALKNAKSGSVPHNAGPSTAGPSPLAVDIPERRHSTTAVEGDVVAKTNSGNTPTTPGVPRKSTQMSRAPRPSEDFDRRFDGPYSRPSITMTRRQSSGTNVVSPTGGPRRSEPNATIPERHSQAEDGAPPPPSVDTLQSDPAFEPEPPSLNYTLRTKKRIRALWLFWTVVIFDSVVMPIALYFGLWYTVYQDGRMSANTVFSIVTAAIGGISIFEYFVRLWALWKKDSNCRPTGAGRYYFDWFLWHYTLGWIIVMLELVM